jgi:carbamoyl-phosphate synthase large subunit
MKSTGEVMGIDRTEGMAFLKSQVAAGANLPKDGNIFLSVRDDDKDATVGLARRLTALGYSIYATLGTSTMLIENGVACNAVFRISKGRPSVIDMVEAKQVGWIINTSSSGASPRIDEIKMRSHAVIRGVPITTTIAGLRAAVNGLEALKKSKTMEVCSLQEYHRHFKKINLPKIAEA